MNKQQFIRGMRHGIPIALGYLAVSFAIGISAQAAGIGTLQAGVMSLLNLTSAGEAAAVTLIAAGASYGEMALTTLVVNLRYMLMSCALSQRFSPQVGTGSRLLMGYGITDEIFGISVAEPVGLSPWFVYGAIAVAAPGWTLGTVLGVVGGNLLPAAVTAALGVALYGMFCAVVVPPARQNPVIAVTCLAAMLCSWLFTVLPYLSRLPEGFRIILLTVGISAVAALLFPREEGEEEKADA